MSRTKLTEALTEFAEAIQNREDFDDAVKSAVKAIQSIADNAAAEVRRDLEDEIRMLKNNLRSS